MRSGGGGGDGGSDGIISEGALPVAVVTAGAGHLSGSGVVYLFFYVRINCVPS